MCAHVSVAPISLQLFEDGAGLIRSSLRFDCSDVKVDVQKSGPIVRALRGVYLF